MVVKLMVGRKEGWESGRHVRAVGPGGALTHTAGARRWGQAGGGSGVGVGGPKWWWCGGSKSALADRAVARVTAWPSRD
uniref:Uncharacterized protein n=1 Tax=Oryza meridionalis TaxID=40149 RepID=A0A0E0ENL3_9ORYZ